MRKFLLPVALAAVTFSVSANKLALKYDRPAEFFEETGRESLKRELSPRMPIKLSLRSVQLLTRRITRLQIRCNRRCKVITARAISRSER